MVPVEEGAVGVVQDGEDREVGIDQLADQAQQVRLIEEVEVRTRLVEEDETGLLGQNPGDADELLFPPRQLGVRALLQVDNADSFQRGDADLHVLLLGDVGDVAGAAGQDHVLHGKGEDRPVVLGQIAEDAGPPPGREGADFLSHDMHFAALEVEKTAENAHERRFAAAVLAEQDGKLPSRDLQRDLVEDRPPFVGKGELLDLDGRR